VTRKHQRPALSGGSLPRPWPVVIFRKELLATVLWHGLSHKSQQKLHRQQKPSDPSHSRGPSCPGRHEPRRPRKRCEEKKKSLGATCTLTLSVWSSTAPSTRRSSAAVAKTLGTSTTSPVPRFVCVVVAVVTGRTPCVKVGKGGVKRQFHS